MLYYFLFWPTSLLKDRLFVFFGLGRLDYDPIRLETPAV
jgi:hypothetical protein